MRLGCRIVAGGGIRVAWHDLGFRLTRRRDHSGQKDAAWRDAPRDESPAVAETLLQEVPREG